MLTYETLRKMLVEEKASKGLIRLPEGFFDSLKAYIENKSKAAQRKENEWELQSAKNTVQDLLELRENKILNQSMYFTRSNVEPGNLAAEEQELFNSLAECLKTFQAKRRLLLEQHKVESIAVALLSTLPEFVGTDMQNYGPFVPGDVATVPKDSAMLLV